MPRYMWSSGDPKEKPLTPGEWELMAICWRLGPASGIEITAAISAQKHIEPFTTTIATQLNRIAKKGFLRMETNPEDGRSRIYTPIIPANRAIRGEARAVLNDLLVRNPEYVRMFVDEIAKSGIDDVAAILTDAAKTARNKK